MHVRITRGRKDGIAQPGPFWVLVVPSPHVSVLVRTRVANEGRVRKIRGATRTQTHPGHPPSSLVMSWLPPSWWRFHGTPRTWETCPVGGRVPRLGRHSEDPTSGSP